jgi:Zn-dependent M28 family amino/carboxypeptidase
MTARNRQLFPWFLGIILLLALIMIASVGGSMIIMPGRSYKGTLPPLSTVETELRDRLRRHVTVLAAEIGERNLSTPGSLAKSTEYISEKFRELGLPLREYSYSVNGNVCVNVEAELKGTTRPDQIVVVGAHYDSVAGSPGADDNGSGVAAMLEVARLLRDSKPGHTIRFVAFVNEEPPSFLGETMGSLVYARRIKERGDNVVAMLSLETIGYYSDQKESQQYPAPFSLFYPDTGNFIGFVGDLGSRELVRRAIKTFRQTTKFPSEGLAAPAGTPGVGWSDHWSFWQVGYPAIMLTDTAPFRYPHYHQSSDTPDKIDYDRMARVVLGVSKVVAELAK